VRTRPCPTARALGLAAAIIAVTFNVAAEPFAYEMYALESSGRRLMSLAEIDRSDNDTVVIEHSQHPLVLNKELRLGNGFAVGLSDHREARITGIGFWLRRTPSPMELNSDEGFSWEWFDQSKGAIFEKRKSSGRIVLGTKSIEGHELVVRVEFLDDITFQINTDARPSPGKYTHEIVIRKGSVLAFKPEAEQS
jgi:hypothetical protein